MTTDKIKEILDNHALWLKGEGGERANLYEANLYEANLREANLREANLYGANLYGANLRGANLREANLREANLYGANLYGADLREANLYEANLYEANLRGANLYEANLRGANLYGADLREANLYGANLRGADLRGADLYGADLYGADLRGANLSGADLNGAKGIIVPIACPGDGSFIGWKKVNGGLIVKLKITESAKRSSATTRKCRCSEAKVLEIQHKDGTAADVESATSTYDNNFTYKVGKIVSINNFDNDRWNECSTGIHFFISRQEAVDY